MGAVPAFSPTVRKSRDANGNRIWVNDVIPDFGDGTYGQVFTDQQLQDAENQRLSNFDAISAPNMRASGESEDDIAARRNMLKTQYAKEGFDPSWSATPSGPGTGGDMLRKIHEGGWITSNIGEADWGSVGYNPNKVTKPGSDAGSRTTQTAGGKRRKAVTRGLFLLNTGGNSGSGTGS